MKIFETLKNIVGIKGKYLMMPNLSSSFFLEPMIDSCQTRKFMRFPFSSRDRHREGEKVAITDLEVKHQVSFGFGIPGFQDNEEIRNK